MGLAKAGVKLLFRRFQHFSPQKTIFVFLFFVILKKRKWILLGSGLVGISGFLIPAFAKPFSVMRHRIKTRYE